MTVEFMWFQMCLDDGRLQPSAYLVDVHDEQQAISKTERVAESGKPSTVAGLFALENGEIIRAVRGWRKGHSGELKELAANDVECVFRVTKDTFDRGRPLPGDLEAWRKRRSE